MEIAIGILIVIVGTMFAASLFGFDDLLKAAIEAKMKVAEETRRTAEANLEAARLAASAANKSL